jgi:hypothetical protein
MVPFIANMAVSMSNYMMVRFDDQEITWQLKFGVGMRQTTIMKSSAKVANDQAYESSR